MASVVLTIPIATAQVEAWRRFCQEMAGSRNEMYKASRRLMGITRESMALVENALGSSAILTLEAVNIGWMLEQLFSSDEPFDTWYREQNQVLYGASVGIYGQFSLPVPLSTMQTICFEWADERRSN